MMQKDTLNKFMKVQQDKRENTCVCSFCLQMFDNLNDLQDHLILHDPLNLPNGQYNDCMDTDCVNDIIDLDLRNSMKKYGSKLTKTKQNYSDKQQSISSAIQTLLQCKNVRFKRKRDDDEEDDEKDNYNDDYDEEEENDDDDDDDDEEEEEDDYSNNDDDDTEENDDDDDDEEKEADYSDNDNDDDDDEEEEDSDDFKDDDDDEEIESLDDENNGDDDEWKERVKGVKRGPDKMCAKKEEEEKKDNEIKEIDHVAHTESVRYKLLMQSDILRRLETKVKTMKESPRTHENNNRFLSQDGKMTVEKSTQTGSVNEDSNQGCCQCRTCSCKCHAHLRNDMQNALKCSKKMFQSNIFPKEKDKKRLLTKTLTIQTVNKWFINYRYHFFLHIKKHAADTITSKSTTVEINRLTNKHYAKCFQCVSKKPKRHSKQQVKRAFMAWRYALQTNINPEKYMRQALKS